MKIGDMKARDLFYLNIIHNSSLIYQFSERNLQQTTGIPIAPELIAKPAVSIGATSPTIDYCISSRNPYEIKVNFLYNNPVNLHKSRNYFLFNNKCARRSNVYVLMFVVY